jgi:hypothetical protein
MTAAAVNLTRTRTVGALLAIRESEIAAQASGVPVARYKTLAFGCPRSTPAWPAGSSPSWSASCRPTPSTCSCRSTSS